MTSTVMQQMLDFHAHWLQHMKAPIHSTHHDANHSPLSNSSATSPVTQNCNMVLSTMNLTVRDYKDINMQQAGRK